MKKKTMAILAFGCGLVLAGGLATNFVLDESRVPTKTFNSSSYQVAALSDKGTIDKEDDTKIVSSFGNVDGMAITYGEGATIEYRLGWFDEDGKYLSATETLTGDWAGEAPEDAVKFRVEINPVGDEDGKVTVFELPGYVSQIEVTFNK